MMGCDGATAATWNAPRKTHAATPAVRRPWKPSSRQAGQGCVP
eukprot:CAMPEP_0206168782 /NCGR_PEP_ID=MMETSP1474-20131121/33387_1 /ASSEMBLY_ACC=CAM_ASM_001110 /TAXON_ID=97495 /ORGANISM="Imantonia sp., Strain RCC918" /LENGTH=42 /DNA_ID= /DNA_START= /DNA_END= /DNA_ORIENTATION=